MTRREYYDIREEIGIHGQVCNFLEYTRQMLEIYPEFRKMSLGDIHEYLDKKEIYYELDIQKKLKVE